MPTWISFMLEIASSELGVRGTAGLPNLAASPSELSTPLMSRLCHNKIASYLQVERGEPLLDARSGDLASFDLDPARHLQRLNIGKGSDVCIRFSSAGRDTLR